MKKICTLVFIVLLQTVVFSQKNTKILSEFEVQFACNPYNQFFTKCSVVDAEKTSKAKYKWLATYNNSIVAKAKGDSLFVTGHRGDTIVVTLKMKDATGKNIIRKQIQIPAKLSVDFSAPEAVCENTPLKLEWNGNWQPKSFHWEIESGSTFVSESNSLEFNVRSATTNHLLIVNLAAQDSLGCVTESMKRIHVNGNYMGNIRIYAGKIKDESDIADTIYVSEDPVFRRLADMSTAVRFEWSNGAITQEKYLSPVTPGEYKVIAIDKFGCRKQSEPFIVPDKKR
jgi:hypothetical protein